MESSFQLRIAYGMLYYVKLTVLSIKTISRSLTLVVLQISALHACRQNAKLLVSAKLMMYLALAFILCIRYAVN